jgi:hypothetical protein
LSRFARLHEGRLFLGDFEFLGWSDDEGFGVGQ